ncbi:hypothetical protein CWI39_0038p0010 [Hamiltosporidium magnivora]|uniref:Uncharacterized protein n=1 Tax=Hamiltosporidium magnivora TaxID=148818 RepID=A0A4Q9LQF6_9MICR|nr:hypothetical protein CWI39_0038p0010 [Hamiltosporidium magnivora]
MLLDYPRGIRPVKNFISVVLSLSLSPIIAHFEPDRTIPFESLIRRTYLICFYFID